jgi:nucleoside-diphosphate-sugar epimerase
MSQDVIVFGGSGFIGTHLVRRLASGSRNGKIISVDIREPRERISGVDYRRADVRNLGAFDPGDNTARIYNLAAVHTTPGHQPHEYFETNIAGALEITKLAERSNIKEIVFTSSISIYGPSEEMKTEQSQPAPVSAYGRSKLLAEQVHNDWLDRAAGRVLTVVRPAVVFGPGEGGNFTRMAALLAKGFFIYPGRKDTIKACIYVQDLLDAIEYARSNNSRKVVFNGAYPERYTLEQIVGTLVRNHFPRAHTVLIPRAAVTAIARILGFVDVFNLGIHPERVTKLVQSTDIYPSWLADSGFKFPTSLEDVLMRWSKQTNASFV